MESRVTWAYWTKLLPCTGSKKVALRQKQLMHLQDLEESARKTRGRPSWAPPESAAFPDSLEGIACNPTEVGGQCDGFMRDYKSDDICFVGASDAGVRYEKEFSASTHGCRRRPGELP